jgi:nitrogen fixation protein NifU and related proteins
VAASQFSPYNGSMSEIENALLERLRAIYSETTIEHILHPHNTDRFPNPDGYAAYSGGDGETMKIWLRVRDNFVEDAGFWTSGCAATIASGSMVTELAKGKSIMEALAMTAQDIADALVDLPPGNFHCAEMAANTLRVALKDCLSIQREPWKKLYRK